MARLALVLCAVALAAGCPGGSGDDDYPIGGSGRPGGNSGTGGADDAGVDGSTDGGRPISGRVCLLTDLRKLVNPADCAPMNANNLQVALGAAPPVTTTGDGSFTTTEQVGTNLVWTVTGGQLVRSIVPFSASTLLPAIRDSVYTELAGQNNVIINPGQGSVIARIVRNNAAVPGWTAQIVGGESQQTLYDVDSPVLWGPTQSGTGPLGIAWLPDNLATGDRTLRVTRSSNAMSFDTTVRIVDGAITFVTIAVP